MRHRQVCVPPSSDDWRESRTGKVCENVSKFRPHSKVGRDQTVGSPLGVR